MSHKKHNCLDCNKIITNFYAVRCNSCSGKRKVFTQAHRENLSIALKGKPQPWNKGSNNASWKGGRKSINQALRDSIEYEEWRTKIFERDLYTCQQCRQIGGYLQADHIKRFISYPELRFELSNGQTLCRSCHLKKTAFENKIYWKNQYSKEVDIQG